MRRRFSVIGEDTGPVNVVAERALQGQAFGGEGPGGGSGEDVFIAQKHDNLTIPFCIPAPLAKRRGRALWRTFVLTPIRHGGQLAGV